MERLKCRENERERERERDRHILSRLKIFLVFVWPLRQHRGGSSTSFQQEYHDGHLNKSFSIVLSLIKNDEPSDNYH